MLCQRDLERQEAIATEARVHPLQPPEALEKQSRSREQHEHERDLRDDQRPAGASLTARGGAASSRLIRAGRLAA